MELAWIPTSRSIFVAAVSLPICIQAVLCSRVEIKANRLEASAFGQEEKDD
uniref:Uncharacterized protein n=1 Tax=Arundo donax TaxID=35708 RepID=A0A0A8YYA9_ARUDO